MKLFRFLLWLLPSDFRREYGAQIAATVSDHWADIKEEAGWGTRLRFWTREALAVTRTAAGFRAENRQAKTREGLMEGLGKDLKHSVRSLLRRPSFTVVAILTLALGIGATTAMFSAVNAVLLRDLPYNASDQIVALFQVDTQDGERSEGVSAANIRDLAEASTLLSDAAVADPWSHDLIEDGRAISLRSWAVSEGFFEAIGAVPQQGRVFLPEEYLPDSEPVVMVGHSTWQGRFGSDPSLVGRTIVLDGVARTVVGILPQGFAYPQPAELWSPRPHQSWDANSRAASYMDGVARLAPGVTLVQAQAEIDQISRSLAEQYPRTNGNVTIQSVPLRTFLFGDVQSPLFVLLGAVALVLLIAAANVAGLQLARWAGRSREYALRGALGASSRRLLRLVAVESTILALAGCGLGVLLAFAGVKGIRLLAPDHLPRIDELSMDGSVLLFAVAAAIISALVSSFIPALRASGTKLQLALSEGGRGAGAGRRANRLRDQLVVGEIALALVLSIGAGLLVRSFDQLLSKELGFEPEGRLAVQAFAYGDDGNPNTDFLAQSLEQIRAVPGVEAVAVTTNLPLADDQTIASIDITVPFTVDDRDPPPEGQEPTLSISSISEGFGDVLRIPIVEGRGFSSVDNAEGPPTVIINEALARRHFANRSPIGQRITVRFGQLQSREIVGVIADVRPKGFGSEPRPEAYTSIDQTPSGSLTYVIQTAGDPALLAAPVQEAIWQVNPSQAIWAARTMPDLLIDWTRQRRFNLALLGAFAFLALSLAAIGVYGLMSFSVEQRVSEIGIRRALGGESRDLLRMVLGRGVVLGFLGVAVGLVGSLVLTRLLQGMLFEVEPFDPITFVTLSGVVLTVAVLAALVPANRATKVDPLVALRAE
ncbi:MAG: ABC transporter permease [Longimicrobiales bacterium]